MAVFVVLMQNCFVYFGVGVLFCVLAAGAACGCAAALVVPSLITNF
ncbi:Hypothetical protein ADU72_1418 [Pediococcus damnosus]|uniref:Transmembrane protein n=1 Tax=Pediococcus damnosus TaxID=51663 RepID=A0ABN4NA03_9LACO|nr:Hypothetical protein ADU72_1418 [Pediococcus damnosus]